MKIELREEGGVMVPNLSPAESRPTEMGPLARKRLAFLKKERPVLYTRLLSSGKLDAHLAEVERSASEMTEALVARSAKSQGVDEALKRDHPDQWAKAMGEIRATANATVMREVVLA